MVARFLAARGGLACALDPAVLYYTKALRGAAATYPGHESPGFQQLAQLHYQAVELRRERNFQSAAAVYRRAIAMQRCGTLPHAVEVRAAVVAAHATLNLALTEQARRSFASAQRVFQNGVTTVQELIRTDFNAWVDGQHRVRLLEKAEYSVALQQALKWLATLLTAWGLLETKCGRTGPARRLVSRAANLDSGKSTVLRWKLMSEHTAAVRVLNCDGRALSPPSFPISSALLVSAIDAS